MLLLSICVLAASAHGLFHYPLLNGDEIWTGIVPEELVCPVSARETQEALIKVTMHVIRYSPHDGEGFICHKLAYDRICTTNAIWVRSYSRRIREVPIEEEECREGIESWKKAGGTGVTPFFPSPDCVWEIFSTRTQTKTYTFVVVGKLKVDVDMYFGHFVSSLFPGGVCAEDYCPTIRRGSAWIPSSPLGDICGAQGTKKGFSLFEANLRTSKTKPYKATISMAGFHDGLTGGCRTKFCGKPMYLSHRKVPFEIFYNMDNMNSELKGLYDLIIGSIPECPIGVEAEALTDASITESLHLTDIQELRWGLCLAAKDLITSTGKVLNRQLALFIPDQDIHRGNAYRVSKEKGLEHAVVKYVKIKERSYKPWEIGHYPVDNGTVVLMSSPPHNSSRCPGPDVNGWMLNPDCSLRESMEYMEEEEELSEVELDLSLKAVRHPVHHTISNFSSDYMVSLHGHASNIDPGKTVSEFFSSWKGALALGFLSTALMVLGYAACWFLVPCCGPCTTACCMCGCYLCRKCFKKNRANDPEASGHEYEMVGGRDERLSEDSDGF